MLDTKYFGIVLTLVAYIPGSKISSKIKLSSQYPTYKYRHNYFISLKAFWYRL